MYVWLYLNQIQANVIHLQLNTILYRVCFYSSPMVEIFYVQWSEKKYWKWLEATFYLACTLFLSIFYIRKNSSVFIIIYLFWSRYTFFQSFWLGMIPKIASHSYNNSREFAYAEPEYWISILFLMACESMSTNCFTSMIKTDFFYFRFDVQFCRFSTHLFPESPNIRIL